MYGEVDVLENSLILTEAVCYQDNNNNILV